MRNKSNANLAPVTFTQLHRPLSNEYACEDLRLASHRRSRINASTTSLRSCKKIALWSQDNDELRKSYKLQQLDNITSYFGSVRELTYDEQRRLFFGKSGPENRGDLLAL